MGCGSSTETGRDLSQKLPPGTESFFPTPILTRDVAAAEGASSHSNTGGKLHETTQKPSNTPSANSLKKPPQSAKASPSTSSIKKKEAYVPPQPPPTGIEQEVESSSNSSPYSPSKSKKKAYVPPSPLPAVDLEKNSAKTPASGPAAVLPKQSHSSPRSLTQAVEAKMSQPNDNSHVGSGDEDEGSFSHDDFLLSTTEVPSAQRPDVLGSVADLLGDNTDIFDIIGQEHRPDFYQSSEDNSIDDDNVNRRNTGKDSAETSLDDFMQEEVDAGMPQVQIGLHETPQPSASSGMRFDELYRLKGVLGTGAFSTVREGYHRSNVKQSYAVKCINRKKLSEEDEAALLDEVSILKELRHAHIIRLYDFFEEPSTYYLVMERMRGGELFDRIVAKAYYNEKEARDTCKIILEAIGHCHDNHIAHRDLKPENLLLLTEHDDTSVKIADFGFAKKVYEHNSLTTQCGTPGYVSPEILEGTPYDERADMWSVGVILYILLGGYPPFIESTQRDLFRKIRKGEYEFHEEYWGTVSSEAKELISSLLTVNVNNRLTADEALENQWILGDDAKLAQRDLGSNLQKFRNFNAKRKFRAAVSTVMAINKLNSLKEAFFTPVKETTMELIAKALESEHTRVSTGPGSDGPSDTG
ncbi:hypothetical protein MPSEU_000735500 [Mayamaea pseudoterrestris]|nr:hypothetical protein MPSEU_000735500 [Mayamaea pseudoterrestris]